MGKMNGEEFCLVIGKDCQDILNEKSKGQNSAATFI